MDIHGLQAKLFREWYLKFANGEKVPMETPADLIYDLMPEGVNTENHVLCDNLATVHGVDKSHTGSIVSHALKSLEKAGKVEHVGHGLWKRIA